MKKQIFSLGLIVAATFTLTNCTKEIIHTTHTPENTGIPFEIKASTVATKTTNDGLNTLWTANDAINVFHAEASTTEYVDDGKFTYSADNSFTGELTSEFTGTANDWYAFYPYSSYITTPANVSAGYTKVGSNATQIGNNSMAHLKGDVIPMYGIATNVSNSTTPSIQMNHLTSILEFNITNSSNKPLIVSTIKLTVPESIKIGGTFYVDFSSNDIVYAEKSVYNNATLYVNNGEAISIGGSAKFYMAVKPFTLASADQITYSINGYDKEVTLDKAVTFSAGKIKKINCVYDEQIVSLSHPLTSNIEWTVKDDENEYVNSYSHEATINGTSNVEVLKFGTSSAAGTAAIVIPAGTTKVGFYGVAWKDKSGQIQACADLAVSDENPEGCFYEQELVANVGATSGSPYTITASDTDYYEIVVNDVLGVPAALQDITVTLKTVSGKTRIIIWGLNSYDN